MSPESLPIPETTNDQAPILVSKTPENKTPQKRPSEKREESPPTKPRIFFATLFPLLRSDEKPVLTVPKNAGSVRLRVVHDNLEPFARYRVEIRNQSGDVIFTREIPVSSKNPSRPIDLYIKAATLGAGTYELLLDGIREDKSTKKIKSYEFSIKKK